MNTSPHLAASAEAIAHLQKSLGTMKAAQVLTLMMQWATTMAKNDWQPISAEDLAADWKVANSTAYRWAALYRKAFPNENLPNERILAARAELLKTSETIEPEQIGTAALFIAA